jgi:hypothetical protein
MKEETQKDSLKDEMRNVLEEARMVIPGVQAIFGFQTLAVFNNRFSELPAHGTAAYVLGLGLMALAIALLMTPAAYHRIAERGQVSRRLVNLASGFVTAGMIPLMLGLALDVFVVLLAATEDATVATACGVVSAVVFCGLWFGMPLALRVRR